MLTDSPRIKGWGKLSLTKVVGATVSACANEIRCTGLDGGGATIADEIGGADGADSSACQSNGMAAAVRRTEENRRSEQTQAIPQTVGGRKGICLFLCVFFLLGHSHIWYLCLYQLISSFFVILIWYQANREKIEAFVGRD